MRRSLMIAPLLFVVLFSGCATMSGSDTSVVRTKDRVAPALVHIRPVKEVFLRGERQERVVTGSGFIISPEGYVVTNEHVAGQSRIVRCVLMSREEVEAEVIGTDSYTDLAVLKLEPRDTPYPTVALGESGTLRAGQTVLALGSPHGLARSVTKGIVSQTERYLGGSGRPVALYHTWVQTDAAIYPGNSGGPLVDQRGRVIGVNTRKLSGSDSVGFAIPVDTVKTVVDAILTEGRVRRSWVGIDLQEMLSKTDDPAQRGVVVADVNPVGPAAGAGMRPGDVLVSVAGAPVHARYAEQLADVRRRIAELPVGEPAVFTIRRDGQPREITIRTEELSAMRGREVEFEAWGFTAMDLTQEIIRRAQLEGDQGVLVTGAQVGSPAGNAGLSRGDIILRMDEQPVEDIQALQRLVSERTASGQELVLLDVKRGALTRYVILEPGAAATAGENGESTPEAME